MATTRISGSPNTAAPNTLGASGSPGGDSRLEIDGTRPRQTDRPAMPFRSVLAGGASLLMSGAEVATHVLGGPVLAAAVHDARVGAASTLAGAPVAALGGATAASLGGATASALGGATALGSPATALATGASSGQPDLTSLETMTQAGQASSTQLLALQEQIQQESQCFSTLSNVMRAKYETAKAAVSNIRA